MFCPTENIFEKITLIHTFAAITRNPILFIQINRELLLTCLEDMLICNY